MYSTLKHSRGARARSLLAMRQLYVPKFRGNENNPIFSQFLVISLKVLKFTERDSKVMTFSYDWIQLKSSVIDQSLTCMELDKWTKFSFLRGRVQIAELWQYQ